MNMDGYWMREFWGSDILPSLYKIRDFDVIHYNGNGVWMKVESSFYVDICVDSDMEFSRVSEKEAKEIMERIDQSRNKKEAIMKRTYTRIMEAREEC